MIVAVVVIIGVVLTIVVVVVKIVGVFEWRRLTPQPFLRRLVQVHSRVWEKILRWDLKIYKNCISGEIQI